MAVERSSEVDLIFDSITKRSEDGNIHRSPFEAFSQRPDYTDFDCLRRSIQYGGTVESVMDELADALTFPIVYPERIALHPPRLLRGLIDWKIEHPGDHAEKLIGDAIQIGLATYRRSPEAAVLLADLKETITLQNPNLLLNTISQPEDLVTWLGSDPEKSYRSALSLAFDLEGQNVMFITLGHGGTAAGIDTFLRYVDLSQAPDSKFYVVRFSRRKRNDSAPQVSTEEIEYLRELAQDRRVVVFDEDSVSEDTIIQARAFFGTNIFSGSHVTTQVNSRFGGHTMKKELLSGYTQTNGFIPNFNSKPQVIIIKDEKFTNNNKSYILKQNLKHI